MEVKEVKVEKLEENKVSLQVEVGSDQVDKALEQAYRRVVKKVSIPGFRKGRVPRKLLEMRFGKEVLYEEALEILLPEAYAKAVEEAEIEPIDQPEVEDVQIEEGSPFTFAATVPVKPEVRLGQYKGLQVEKDKVEVTPEEVDEYLEKMREQKAVWKALEEEEAVAAEGDMAIIDFTGYVKGEPLDGGAGENHPLVLGSESFIPGFEEQLVGIKVGEERQLKVTFPEDYPNEELAGVEAEFTVKAKEIKRKELMPLDDEFAKDVSEFATLDELKADTKEKLLQSAESKAETAFREALVKEAVDRAEVDIPEVMVKRRVESMVQDLKQRLEQQGLSLEGYLQYNKKTQEELEEELKPSAEETVKTDLVLETIAKEEEIAPTEEEIEAELSRMAAGFAQEEDKVEEFKETLRKMGQLEVIKENLIRRKTLDILAAEAEIASGDD